MQNQHKIYRDIFIKKKKIHFKFIKLYLSDTHAVEMGDFTHDWLLKWVVGHDGDLRMPSLSSTELWILNKSMASD